MKNWLKILVVVIILAAAYVFFNARGFGTQLRNATSLNQASTSESMMGQVAHDTNFASPLAGSTSSRNKIGIPPTQPGGQADFEEVARPDNRLIVRGANLSILSENVESSVNQFRAAIVNAGGLITTSRITRSPAGIPQGQVTARIPVEKFDQAVQDARQSGIRVADESITGQDVTEQYVDTEARLRNLRASEEQILSILERAEDIDEVLQVQQRLEQVRSQIEQSQARMQYLERSAKLSTINVSFAADEEALPVINPVTRWRPLREIKEASQALLQSLQKVGNFFIWLVIFIPIWLPILIIAYLIRRRQKHTSGT